MPASMSSARRGPHALPPALLLLLLSACVVIFSFLAVSIGVHAAAAAAGAVDVVHLYPEQSRDFQKHICGDVQLFHVHELDPHKVYDLKISYPASLPTTFTVDVQRVLLAPTRTAAGGTVVRKVPRRMLNTEKLRLVPLELLREHVHVPLSGVVGATQQHREERFRFDDLPGARDGDADHHATKDHVAAAPDDADGQEDRHSVQQGEFIIEISVRGDVEGVSPVLDLAQRVCVYNIVVEEMLLAAFPRDTLVLIAWLLVLLALALRVALPFVTSLVALERVQDREISSDLSPEQQHTKTS